MKTLAFVLALATAAHADVPAFSLLSVRSSFLVTDVLAPAAPLDRVDPMNAQESTRRGITTRHPRFAAWFADAKQVARTMWDFPKVVNRYGHEITPEEYLEAILFIESKGVHRESSGKILTSEAGARGFMQLMPATAAGLGVKIDDPYDNLIGGTRYLGQCFESKAMRTPGDSPADRLAKAAAAYNTGPGRKSLAGNTWDAYVSKGNSETVYYGIQLKMALGLELSRTEEQWLARNKGVRPGELKLFVDDTYARSHGIVNA